MEWAAWRWAAPPSNFIDLACAAGGFRSPAFVGTMPKSKAQLAGIELIVRTTRPILQFREADKVLGLKHGG
jgi:hypothetical protein